MKLEKSLTYASCEDGVVTFEYENGETVQCKKCNVEHIEEYKPNDIIIAIVDNGDDDVKICLLQLNKKMMEERSAEIAALEERLAKRMRNN